MINILLAGPYQVKGLSEKTMIWSYQKAWLFNLKLKKFYFSNAVKWTCFRQMSIVLNWLYLKKWKGWMNKSWLNLTPKGNVEKLRIPTYTFRSIKIENLAPPPFLYKCSKFKPPKVIQAFLYSVQCIKFFLLFILISKRHIMEKHFMVIVTMLGELN